MIPQQYKEYAADVLAYHILAPACVIWGLNLHTPQDIATLCDISMESATYRSIRMSELYRKNKFLKHPLEREVFELFKDFINEYKLSR